jgi:hypothetical protein
MLADDEKGEFLGDFKQELPLNETGFRELASTLKQRCGTGGSESARACHQIVAISRPGGEFLAPATSPTTSGVGRLAEDLDVAAVGVANRTLFWMAATSLLQKSRPL